MPIEDSTNPGTVTIANEGYGHGIAYPDQPVTVTPPSNAGQEVNAANFEPGSKSSDVTPGDEVPNQTFSPGLGLPTNVFV